MRQRGSRAAAGEAGVHRALNDYDDEREEAGQDQPGHDSNGYVTEK